MSTTSDEAIVRTAAIADALGGTALTVQSPYYDDHKYYYVLLAGSTDYKRDPALELGYSPYRHNGQIQISPVWPREEIHGTVTPATASRPSAERQPAPPDAIYVSLSKTPAQIARDIERRLLPTYLPWHARCRAYIEEWVTFRNGKRALRDQLAALWTGHTYDDAPYDRGKDSIVDYNGRRDLHARVELSGPDKVYRITIDRPTPEQAAAIIRHLETIDIE